MPSLETICAHLNSDVHLHFNCFIGSLQMPDTVLLSKSLSSIPYTRRLYGDEQMK